MFKILRKSWTEGGISQSPSPAPSSQDAETSSLNLADNSDVTPAPHSALRQSSVAPNKRTRDDFEPESVDQSLSERPAKFIKTGNADLLRYHLPEILASREKDEQPTAPTSVTLKARILEQSKHLNTIAVLPLTKSSIGLLVDVVSWAVEQEKDRLRKLPENMRLRSRTALVVIDDITTMDRYYNAFEKSIQGVSIGKYTEESHRPQLDIWSDLLKKDIVMTSASLLHESLMRSALAVTQLNLLVISDAQIIKNQDSHASMPIVQVMNDFYKITDSLSRPRIFALASLPSEHFDSKMLKLEETLDSRVYGVSEEKRAEILALPDRPNEIVILYDGARRSTETRLLKQLHQIDPSESIFRRHYRDSRIAHDDVGPCASDLIWRRALRAIEGDLIPGYDDIDDDDIDIPVSDRTKLRIYRLVKNWTFNMPNLDVSSRGFNVSHKFMRLVHLLNTFKNHGEGFRGIIFVQRRAIAMVLADLLRTLDDRFLRPQPVTCPKNESEMSNIQEIFNNFATGVCNLLVATKSIEDLDVPRASVVIRYDLFESQVSHAYVRARTRGRESHLVHMVQRGNDAHRRIIHRLTNIDADMLRWTETLCNSPESSVPPESLRETINPYNSDTEDEDQESPSNFIEDPTTNGRIYLKDATTVIYRYAASVRSKFPEIPGNRPLFLFKDVHKEFGIPRAHICSINLPGTPIDGVVGDISSTKAQARRSACFRACERLYSSGLLDCRLVPIPSRLRAQYQYENRRSSESMPDIKPTAGTRPYGRKHPNFWENAARRPSTTYYPTVIFVPQPVDQSNEQFETFAPITILTKQPLPDLRTFRLFVAGEVINVEFQKAMPLALDEEHLKIAHLFTLRLCRAVMNKSLTCSLEDMTYFFLPLPNRWRPANTPPLHLPEIMNDILWETASQAGQHWTVPIKHTTLEELKMDLDDAIVQDRWIEFTRRYRVDQIRPDLTPFSKPSDSMREASYKSLFDFCKSKRKGLETLSNPDQPIIQVSKVHPVLNLLNPISKPPASSSKSAAKYLIPELCAKFTVPASTLWTAMLLPSVLRRMDDLLLVKELDAKFFDHAIQEDLLHNAICTPSAGLEYDYERLELLGDAFLKYLSSIYTFVTNPSLSEGALHVARQRFISNKSLLLHSTRVGLPEYIQSKVFSYKTWQPPNFYIYTPPKVPKGMDVDDGEGNKGDARDGEEDDREASIHEDVEGSNIIDSLLQDINDSAEEEIAPRLDGADFDKEKSRLDGADVYKEESIAEPPGLDASRAATPMIEDPQEDNILPPTESKAASFKKKIKYRKKKANTISQDMQWLGDKAIADVAEAIVGAAYISGGREGALQATKALTIPLSNIDRWSDFGRKVLTPPPNSIAKLRPGSVEAIENIIGHNFNRPHLLSQAMSHSSIQGYETTSYERLEFIGDAILDFMVIRHIYDRDQQLSPGGLTMLKGAMVSNAALAAVCVWSGLHEHLLYDSPELAAGIQSYINELKERQEEEYKLAEREGRDPGQYWQDLEPPKALSDVVESIVGAIYISDNFSPVGAEALFDNVLKPFYDKHITLQTLSHHPTKILFELLQAQGCHQFELTREKVAKMIRCEIVVHDVVLTSAEDSSPYSAGRTASALALDALEGDADFMTRTCDCRAHIAHTQKIRQVTSFEEALERALAAPDGYEPEGEDAQKPEGEDAQITEVKISDTPD